MPPYPLNLDLFTNELCISLMPSWEPILSYPFSFYFTKRDIVFYDCYFPDDFTEFYDPFLCLNNDFPLNCFKFSCSSDADSSTPFIYTEKSTCPIEPLSLSEYFKFLRFKIFLWSKEVRRTGFMSSLSP